MATRWARSAAILPMPRSVSSGRSPAVPMMTVIGRRPTGRPAGDALGDVEHGRDAGLVVGEVHDDDLRRRAGTGSAGPGDRSASGRKSTQAVADLGDRRPEAARAAGGRERVGDVVAGQAADRDRDPADLGDVRLVRAVRLDQPAAPDEVRPAAALRRGGGRCGEPPSGWSEKYATFARTRRATAATYGSSPLSTTQPSGFVIRQIVDLTSASSGSVWMPWRSR